MTATEYIYYGFGQVVYSLAFSDGQIQPSEKNKLEEIISSELEKHHSIQVTSIIFKLLEKDTFSTVNDAFQEGIKNIKLGDNHLTVKLLNLFTNILRKIAIAFPPETNEEKQIVLTFKEAFNHIK
jgi:hypothetical protein